ncbi:MAG: methyltransferase domain-containing protein [Chthoniobacterales bacterium]|nr:methyltransferase domain-containing protein [Chthoniobacterales bacterium]
MSKGQPPAHKGITFPESPLAHKILDGLEGLEIGPAAHNPFGLKTRAVGLTRDGDAQDFDYYARMQLAMCGSVAAIDLPGDAAALPLADASTGFVLHSHVWEHLPNPLAALDEWVRVVKPDGFIFAIVPKRNARGHEHLKGDHLRAYRSSTASTCRADCRQSIDRVRW